MTQRQNNDHFFWLDAARTVAVVAISLNHAVNRVYSGIYAEQYLEFADRSRPSLVLEVLLWIFSRLGVPLFLMISGALLMKKHIDGTEDIRQFYKHNLLSLFVTAEIWYFIMYWFIVLTDGISDSFWHLLWGCVKTLLFMDQVTMGSMWYIPLILCLYILLPLFVLAMRKSSPKFFILPSVLITVCSFLIPNLNDFFALIESNTVLELELSSSRLFSFYFLYLFLGYWISQGGMQKLSNLTVVSGALISFFATCGYQLFAFRCVYDYTIDYDFTGILLCSIFVFELIRRSAGLFIRLQKTCAYLASISFGIYFVHILIMQPLYTEGYCEAWASSLGKCSAVLCVESISFLGSILVISLLCKIPFCKKYLFRIRSPIAQITQ